MRSFSFASALLTIAVVSGACDSASSPVPMPEPEDQDEAPATVPIFAPGTAQVLVTNTTSQPVPTQAVGTTAINGAVAASQAGSWVVDAEQAGSWSVGATQQGPWSVDVASLPPLPPVSLTAGTSVSVGSLPPVTLAGTPAVTIANMPNVAVTGTVAIANTEDDEAVPVRVVGDAGGGGAERREPWVGGGQIIIPNGASYESVQFRNTQAGKLLVVEQFTIEAAVPTGQVAYQVSMLASVNGVPARMLFTLQPAPKVDANFDRFTRDAQVKFNVGGGLVVVVSRTGTTGTSIANVAFSGYIIDLPTP